MVLQPRTPRWSAMFTCVLMSLLLTVQVSSFSPSVAFVQKLPTTNHRNHLQASVDGNTDKPDYETLASVYPKQVPAGLRGEAVRSALLSKQCLAWKYDFSSNDNSSGTARSLVSGWIQVTGKGTMDFLNSKLSSSLHGSFSKTCLLTPKGRLVDQVNVAIVSSTQAYMWTSPGCAGRTLYERLNPFVFPMDEVALMNFQNDEIVMFSLASTSSHHVNDVFTKYMKPLLQSHIKDTSRLSLPTSSTESVHLHLKENNGASLTIMPHIPLPSVAANGYTFCFVKSHEIALGVYQHLVGDENVQGPVEIGPLEYETLRIEAAQPGYSKELTAGSNSKHKEKSDKKKLVPANPLELHWDKEYIDLEKGCFLGQEGIASVVKNPRGPARTLYSVIFNDKSNPYDDQEYLYDEPNEDDDDDDPTPFVIPKVDNELCVLGSSDEIGVGTLSSVAEPSGTGEGTIVAMALIRRSDSIRNKMKEMDITMTRENNNNVRDTEASGMIDPPPMDPLDGLKVVVKGTQTEGILRSIPSRRCYSGSKNMFLQGMEQSQEEQEAHSVMGFQTVGGEPVEPRDPFGNNNIKQDDILDATIEDDDCEEEETDQEDEQDLELALEEAKRAQEEAEAEAAEAKRKAEKMAMLKKRAEEAMAKRRAKKKQQ